VAIVTTQLKDRPTFHQLFSANIYTADTLRVNVWLTVVPSHLTLQSRVSIRK